MRIELRDLVMRFGDVLAVNHLNAVFEDGELIALLGPSGCGKSTTLFLLAGLYKPTDGAILFDGKIMNDIEPEHRHIGMVFQNYALYPHMTVRQNIAFPLRMLKVPKAEQQERVEAIAELVKIHHLLDRKPAQLSGGQQQRVAIARALVKKPQVLLLDEPLSNLDARLRLEMREEIRRIQQEVGITTIFVTHDQEEAMSISDRILLMKDGVLQQFDQPQTMYDAPNNLFVAEFLGTPPINILKAQSNLARSSFDLIDEQGTTIQSLAIPEPLGPAFQEFFQKTAQFFIGIRPELATVQYDAAPPQSPLNFTLSGTIVYQETIGRDNLIRVDLTRLSADHTSNHPTTNDSSALSSLKKLKSEPKLQPHTSLRLLVPAHQPLKIGITVTIVIRPEHMLFFSGRDGTRIMTHSEPHRTESSTIHATQGKEV